MLSTSTSTNAIINITSQDQLTKLIKSKPQSLLVIDFHAQWCPPCHAIAPFYESLAKTYPFVTFTKCDVDECKPVAQTYRISAMPTFVFIKGSQTLQEVKGANRPALEAAVKKHSNGNNASGYQWGNTGHRLGTEEEVSTTTTNSTTPSIPINLQHAQTYLGTLSPQAKMGIGLLLAYVIMVYLS